MQIMRTYWWGAVGNLDSGQVILEHPRDVGTQLYEALREHHRVILSSGASPTKIGDKQTIF